ncbi:MAG: class I SAM-dependent methyltransferase [Acidimicrobiia bacterium]|jgi:2-polyprenyl-3-methyl-5-hydroxy-6-metoxy-1,4-benzoquinol methylase
MAASAEPGQVRVAVERVSRCPLCGSGDQRRWFASRDRLHRLDQQDFTYSRCRTCRLVYLSVRPTREDSGRLYPDDYAPYLTSAGARELGETAPASGRPASAPSQPRPRRVTRFVGKAVDRVLPNRLPGVLDAVYTPRPPGALVDYGCGGPAFLDQARTRGWATTIGVDMNPGVVARVADAGHRGVLAGDFGDAVADGSLAVVRLNHVLEHLYDPVEALSTIRSKVAPGGTVHIAVPNGASVWAALFRSDWFNSDPRHLVQYAPAQLRRLAALAGFSDVLIVHEVITKDIARSWGYVRERRGSLDHAGVEALAADKRLQVLLEYPARFSAAIGRGDRFHALLRVTG